MSYQNHDTIELDAKMLAASILFCVDAAATDDREHMRGVHIKKKLSKTVVTATDGHRIHCASFENKTGHDAEGDFFGTGETFLATPDAKRLHKEVSLFYREHPKLCCRVAPTTDDALQVSLKSETDGDARSWYVAKRVDHQFPSVQTAIKPEVHGGERPSIHAGYIEQVARNYRTASSLLGGTPSALQIVVGQNNEDPLRLMARVVENVDSKKNVLGERSIDFLAYILPYGSGIGAEDWDEAASDILKGLRE